MTKHVLHLDLNTEKNAEGVDITSRAMFSVAEKIVLDCIPKNILEEMMESGQTETIRTAIATVLCNIFAQAVVGGLGCGHKEHAKKLMEAVTAMIPGVMDQMTSVMPSADDDHGVGIEMPEEAKKWMN